MSEPTAEAMRRLMEAVLQRARSTERSQRVARITGSSEPTEPTT